MIIIKDFITPVLGKGNFPYDDSKLLAEQALHLNDGRPVIAQLWAEDSYTYLTYYFSSADIESANNEYLHNYLNQQGFKLSYQRHFSAIKFTDNCGNPCWNYTITIGEIEE